MLLPNSFAVSFNSCISSAVAPLIACTFDIDFSNVLPTSIVFETMSFILLIAAEIRFAAKFPIATAKLASPPFSAFSKLWSKSSAASLASLSLSLFSFKSPESSPIFCASAFASSLFLSCAVATSIYLFLSCWSSDSCRSTFSVSVSALSAAALLSACICASAVVCFSISALLFSSAAVSLLILMRKSVAFALVGSSPSEINLLYSFLSASTFACWISAALFMVAMRFSSPSCDFVQSPMPAAAALNSLSLSRIARFAAASPAFRFVISIEKLAPRFSAIISPP